MKTATITEAKNSLSALLARVRAGESIVITDRGLPVAVLEPAPGRVDPEDRMAKLERAGIIRRGRGGPSAVLEAVRTPPPRLEQDVDVVAMVVDERESAW